MTPLSLDAPLRSLRALCGLSHRALGERLMPPVSDVAVVKAEANGPRIKLSTLSSYARAAGYALRVEARFRLSAYRDRSVVYKTSTADIDITVAGARALLEALGLKMTLAVEPAGMVEKTMTAVDMR